VISTKKDLEFYLAADKFSLGKKHARPSWLIGDEIWRFQIALRKLEYYLNAPSSPLKRFSLRYYQIQKHRLGIKLGFFIPPNVFGPGLRINHFGNIVVNPHARVGAWCDIHQGVNIGNNPSSDGIVLVPTIGDNVWIGPGAKLFGRITVGSGVAVGANAVVNKDFAGNLTIAGIPAKIINHQGTESMNVGASINRTRVFVEEHPEYADYFRGLAVTANPAPAVR
jgi:serine O-acetyltransferase